MTKKFIVNILGNTPANVEFAAILYDMMPAYHINTNLRQVHFLAQTCHESDYYTQLEENLNYSTQLLLKTWPSRFTKALATKYGKNSAHPANPVMIANIAYANRMGNGDVASGDGYKYRGRGLIQLTGKDNYRQFALDSFDSDAVLKNPDLVLKYKKTTVRSACWFWQKNNINAAADKDDVALVTKIINGGDNGLAERIKITKAIKRLLGV